MATKETTNFVDVNRPKTRIDVPIGHAHAFHSDENVSRCGDLFEDQKDMVELASQLYPGWQVQLGDAGLYELTDVQVIAALKENEKTWIELKDATEEIPVRVGDSTLTTSASDRLRAWESSYVKGGKLIKPKYGQVYAFRRVSVLPLVNAARLKAGAPLIETIPCSVYEFDNDLDRYVACILENTGKTAGARKLSEQDMITGALKMFQTQCAEADFRRVWKVGTAQKLFALCRLAAKHPDLEIIDKIAKGDLKYGPLDKEKLRKAVKSNASANEVTVMLNEPRTNDKKMASKTAIERVAEQTPIRIIAWAFGKAINDDLAAINVLVTNDVLKDELNAAIGKVLKEHNVLLD